MKELILDVEARGAMELIKHTARPGTQYVFSDYNNCVPSEGHSILTGENHVKIEARAM